MCVCVCVVPLCSFFMYPAAIPPPSIFSQGRNKFAMSAVPIWGLAKGHSIFKTNTRVMQRLMPTIKEVKCIMNPLDGGHSTAAK